MQRRVDGRILCLVIVLVLVFILQGCVCQMDTSDAEVLVEKTGKVISVSCDDDMVAIKMEKGDILVGSLLSGQNKLPYYFDPDIDYTVKIVKYNNLLNEYIIVEDKK